MHRLRDVSIRHKLIGIIMLTSILALLLTGVGFIAYEQFTFRGKMTRDFSMLADVICENVSPGLAFNDATAMEKTLQTLAAQQRVLAAAVYDKAGQRVASFQRGKPSEGFAWPERPMPGSYFSADRMDTFQHIVLAGETIGTLYIASDLTELSERRTRYVLISAQVLLISSLVAYLIASRLQRVISDPILSLAETATKVAADKDYALRASKRGADELGSLVDRFNDMLDEIQRQAQSLRGANDQLEHRVQERTRQLREEVAEHQRAREELTQAQRQLVDSSRQAGMAEVATSVLHNVGNVLNSVSVSAEMAAAKVRKIRLGSLKNVTDLLRQHEGDLAGFLTHDPRGRELPGYLIKLTESLAEPQRSVLEELEVLRKNIEHIKEIVAAQQSLARSRGVLESLSVEELVEDALRINQAGLNRHEVELVREFSPVPPLLTDRHKVLQILVNLFSNAKYALSKINREKRMIVRISPHGPAGVRIVVADNGVGIAPENLARIFQHGFTTKAEGHGFGLHGGALTAKELGGQLAVSSPGVDQGAVFTLDLPLEKPGSSGKTTRLFKAPPLRQLAQVAVQTATETGKPIPTITNPPA